MGATLKAAEEDADDTPLPEPAAGLDLKNWKEGTEKYASLDEEAIDQLLGIEDTFPDFNKVDDPNGLIDGWSTEGRAMQTAGNGVPLRLRWHQKVGVLALLENKFAGRNTALADMVGLGKTGQALAFIAASVYYQASFATLGHFPGTFGMF